MKFKRTYNWQPIDPNWKAEGNPQNTNKSGGMEVKIQGLALDPSDSQKVYNHSPDGFAWGYAGSGPAQLALALLLVAGVPKEKAIRYHQPFKMDVVAKIPQNEAWKMSIRTIRDWCKAYERRLSEIINMDKEGLE